jgi:Fe-S oxidoreductase
MPAGHVCCGRPLYDYGFLGLAERYLRTVLDRIRSDVRDGVPVVGIEPSCVAVFKDELVKLLPHDDDAKRLRTQTFHYAEFLRDRDVSLPRLEGRALVWGHCHHKATGGIDSEVELLHALGLETEVATGGCCGLAGSWGFEAGHYELSLRCGEEGILPAVRTADPSTLVVADGFSCRTQIAQATGRDAVHVAQVLHRAQV